MPLFKGEGCKSTPKKVINYITDEKKAKIISSSALDDERNYAEQFREIAKLYGKGDTFDERKYYHFKLSCARSDKVTPEQSHELSEEMVKEYFLEYQCIIATHIDTKTVHSHIIVNAVNFETGKKLHCNNKEYAEMKDKVNELGLDKGLSVLDWRKPSREYITTAENRIQIKGGISWKEELREVISAALQHSTNFIEFNNHLKKYGVTIERNTEKTISFKHPDKIKPIRGEKLGQDYTKDQLSNVKHKLKENFQKVETGRRHENKTFT